MKKILFWCPKYDHLGQIMGRFEENSSNAQIKKPSLRPQWLAAWFCFVVSLISQVVTTPLDHGHDDDYDDDDNLDDDDDDDDEVGVLC